MLFFISITSFITLKSLLFFLIIFLSTRTFLIPVQHRLYSFDTQFFDRKMGAYPFVCQNIYITYLLLSLLCKIHYWRIYKTHQILLVAWTMKHYKLCSNYCSCIPQNLWHRWLSSSMTCANKFGNLESFHKASHLQRLF